MKIYYAAPIRGENSEHAKDILGRLKVDHDVLTEIIFTDETVNHLYDEEIYDRDVEWIKQSDVLIAEVSAPSHGVGYEIGYAIHERNIPVLLLKKNIGILQPEYKPLSAMLQGNPHVTVLYYHDVDHAIDLIHANL